MKNRVDKTRILQACVQKQHELIDNFKLQKAEMHNAAFSRNESASQSDNRRAGKLDLLNALGNELTFAQKELDYLNSLDITKEHTLVEPGAVVITNQLTFFIGVSSEKVEIDGDTIFGISTKAPIYKNMKDLQKGNSFNFNETNYLIEEIY